MGEESGGVPNAEWPFFWLSGCNSQLTEKHEPQGTDDGVKRKIVKKITLKFLESNLRFNFANQSCPVELAYLR